MANMKKKNAVKTNRLRKVFDYFDQVRIEAHA